MKKLLYFAGLVLALGLFWSCDKDEKDSNGSLIGTWQGVKEYETETNNGQLYERTYEYEEGELVWTFKSNGKLEIYEEGEFDGECSYKVNGSKLTLSHQGENITASIKKHDSKELVLERVDLDGADRYTSTMYFEKVK